MICHASVWTSGSSLQSRYARRGSLYGTIISIMSWAQDVSSIAEPPIFLLIFFNGQRGCLSGILWFICPHYYWMLVKRHDNQIPFDETVCDALIANGDVKNPSKRCKMFAMADTSNTVQILVACDVGHTVQFHELFPMTRKNINGQPNEGMCNIRHTVQPY